MNISTHITLKEAITSPTALRLGIDNKPNDTEIKSMQLVAEKCFEPLRLAYGKPIKVNSFFRNEKLNKAVGGSNGSQHCTGEAIDVTAGSKEENKKLFDWCKANLQFDQLINEYDYSWVHISYKLTGNRNQTLIII
jgi:zinc D-Ala-D-Ala carboxypeptidase